MATTVAEQIVIAIAPRFTAALSIFGSSVVCILGYRNLRHDSRSNPGRSGQGGRNKLTYHRLLIGLSVCDLSASTAWFFTTWPIPRGTPNVFAAVGNQHTCTAQAFFAQFSLSAVMYNGALALYYYLMIVKEWTASDIQRVEPWLHLNAFIWGFGTAVASLFLTLFNEVGWDCWISPHPLGCKESWKNNGVTTCTRGDNGSLYQWAFYYAPLWGVIIAVIFFMSSVYWKIKLQERRMRRYSITADDNRSKRMKRSENQARLYVGAFFAAWTFPTIFQLVLVTRDVVYFPLLLLTAIFVPIQGFLNMLVYMRGTYHRYRKANPNSFFIAVWGKMLWSTLRNNDDKAQTESQVQCSTTVVDSPQLHGSNARASFTDDNAEP
jgi:hypothetical protein